MSAKSVKKEAVQTNQKADVMYLGPTIPGAVKYSTVFKNGVFPKNVTERIGQMPCMKELFIPLGELPGAMKELKKENSVLKTIYLQVAEKFM